MISKAKIIQTVTGAFQVNTYIVYCAEKKEGVIIDPGGDTDKILRIVREKNIKIIYILNTHGHADHILANRELKDSLQVPVAMHGADIAYFARPDIKKTAARELGLSASGVADIELHDGDRLKAGELDILVLHTPGHTPGSVCFLADGNLFTGDTLFVGDVGRTDLTGGSLPALLQSIREKIIVLPAETTVRPGHNYGETPTSTLAWEMKENPYITDFILADNGT
ncbi:MAG: MBL fold metallo-hydrolase [Desulfobulbaceae bacterium]|nr:MBL fold metallo-hydrolase [Desulfobulbaceae bacterium]